MVRGEQDIGQNGRREVCTKGERTNGLPGFLYASRTKWLPECCTHRTECPPESLYEGQATVNANNLKHANLSDFRNNFQRVELVAVLQCGSQRRDPGLSDDVR